MQRIPEAELMDAEEQVKAYAYADFSEPHELFVKLFQDKFLEKFQENFSVENFNDIILDLGCGNCDITRRMAVALPDAGFHAVDGSAEMLKYAQQQNYQVNLYQRIKLIEACLPGVHLPQSQYHAIISNSLLHHLHDPIVFWNEIKRLAKPYAYIFVMDLFRPLDESTVQYFVETYAANEPEILKTDFQNSLRAAFTQAEIKKQLKEVDLALTVEEVSDRHIIIYGNA